MCSDLGQGSRICAFYSFTGILFTVSFGSGRQELAQISAGSRGTDVFRENQKCKMDVDVCGLVWTKHIGSVAIACSADQDSIFE